MTPTTLRLIILAAFALLGGFGIAQQVHAAQSPTNYCNQYPVDAGDSYMRSACRDGIKIAEGKSEGATCQDYAFIADQATVDVCNKAVNDRVATKNGAADIVSGQDPEDEPSPTPTPSPSPSRSPTSGNNGSVQDSLDETKSLSDYIDVLHQNGPDADVDTGDVADNEYGKYINGAGKKQDVIPDPSGIPNSPAIIIINGGGWHVNDQNDDKIRGNKPDLNNRTQIGPTAKERGYTVFDLTYRLGSSGVYYMFEDVMRGIKHVRENAGMYGIDPNKIALWGDSSGGSLAVRAGASGKSGAKVTAGWSPPTNAYTAIFRSYKSLFIGMDHSTCIPTDLAGLTNITDLLNGGSGDVAEYGQGLSSNDFTSLGINSDGKPPDAIGLVMQALTAGQYALQTGQNIESISRQLEAANNTGNPTISSISGSGLASGIINMSSKKLIECIDNFEALSPALFASPESTPMFLAGFTTDDVVGPDQVTGMHDKLQTLGIKSETKLIAGDPAAGSNPLGPNPGNHLDYDARFVCPTLNFIDSIIQPDRSPTNCETGYTENLGSADNSTAVASSGTSANTSNQGTASQNNQGSSPQAADTNTNTNTNNCPQPGAGGTGSPLSDFCKSLLPANNNQDKNCNTWSCVNKPVSGSINSGANAQGSVKNCPKGYTTSINGTSCVRVVYEQGYNPNEQ